MADLITSQVKIVTTVKQHEFLSEGRTVTQLGWREIQWWMTTKTKDIPVLQKNDKVELLQIQPVKSQTQPPKRLSDSQLLLAMETANIGTKSSRPDIIKKLEERKYIQRSGQQLLSSMWGRVLIASLAPIWPQVITPEFTSHVEDLMDKVATKEAPYSSMLTTLRQEYLKLHQELLPKLGMYQHLLKEFDLDDQQKKQKNVDNARINKLLETVLIENTS